MQLTSTTGTETSQRSGRGSLLARLNNPIASGLIALLGWLAFALARWQTWAAGHISLFVMAGHTYSRRANLPHVPSKGYDGQFYYRFALNPFNWHHTAYGITVDHNYRYTRLGYPIVAWILSFGQHHLVPTVLVVINLICVGIIGWLGGKFARESGRHALWGLLFAAYFGLVISVGRDTAEPLADACMLGGLLAYRHSRWVLAAILIAYGVITNEPILVVAIAIALTRLYQMYRRQARPGLPDLVWVLPSGRPSQIPAYRSSTGAALAANCGSRTEIQDRCCQGLRASAASHRPMVDAEAAIWQRAASSRASSGQLHLDSGTPDSAGSAHARR